MWNTLQLLLILSVSKTIVDSQSIDPKQVKTHVTCPQLFEIADVLKTVFKSPIPCLTINK